MYILCFIVLKVKIFMRFEALALNGAWRIWLNPTQDKRGSFTRIFCKETFAAHGLETDFVQHNFSTNTHKGTLRGLHYQNTPYEEVKLIHCMRGKICDIVVDIRRDSKTYLQHIALELDDTTPSLLYVPEGFAHGFLTLTDNAEIHYLINKPYTPEAEAGIRWNDKALSINWPDEVKIVSERDAGFPDWQL